MIDHGSSTVGNSCPFCGLRYSGRRNQCSRCGTLLGEAVQDIKRLVKAERRLLQSRKAFSDTFFLVGLLLGGPMITLGENLRIGLFVVLAGAIASVLRRYTDWSTPGTLVVGGISAITIATWLIEPASDLVGSTLAGEDARAGYVTALAEQNQDALVDGRGAGTVAIWFTVSQPGECGEYPPEEVREHLRDLGFLRVVVTGQNRARGLCSFRP